jgi:hypothetical protein
MIVPIVITAVMPKTGISNSPAEAHKPWGPASAAVGKVQKYQPKVPTMETKDIQ